MENLSLRVPASPHLRVSPSPRLRLPVSPFLSAWKDFQLT